MKKEEVPAAALLRPAPKTPRRIHIRCSNKPGWGGITLSNHPHAIHRLGRTHFAGLACDSVLGAIFPNPEDVIRVELTDDGALIQAEGVPRISAIDHSKKKGPITVIPGHRTFANLESFKLKLECI